MVIMQIRKKKKKLCQMNHLMGQWDRWTRQRAAASSRFPPSGAATEPLKQRNGKIQFDSYMIFKWFIFCSRDQVLLEAAATGSTVTTEQNRNRSRAKLFSLSPSSCGLSLPTSGCDNPETKCGVHPLLRGLDDASIRANWRRRQRSTHSRAKNAFRIRCCAFLVCLFVFSFFLNLSCQSDD